MTSYFFTTDINRLKIQKYLIFKESTEHVEPYFMAADIFFLSSREDPFPCVIHEAMAASLPVIIFENTGGAEELVEDTGIILPFADSCAVSDEIFRLRNNDYYRLRLGKSAKRKVHAKYNFKKYWQNIVRFIKDEMEIDFCLEIPPKQLTQKIKKRNPSFEERDQYHTFFNIVQEGKFKINNQYKPIFIAGTTRSGTSIIKLILRKVYISE